MAADALGPVARQDTDDEAADNGDEDLQEPQVVAGRRDERNVPALEEEEVGEEADQSEECEGDERAQNRDRHGDQ